jgi:GntR family transcriptional repressor for pyruvate dehydrogenase complex
LRSIEALGLVEVRRGSGYFVTKMTGNILRGPIEMLLSRNAQPLAEIIEARTVFETAIVGLIVERITDEEIAEAEAEVNEIRSNLTDPKRLLESDQRFHRILYEAAHNSVIYHVHDLVSQIIKNIPGDYLNSEAYMTETHNYHNQLLTALKSRDREKLAEAVEAHNDWIYKVFKIRKEIHSEP